LSVVARVWVAGFSNGRRIAYRLPARSKRGAMWSKRGSSSRVESLPFAKSRRFTTEWPTATTWPSGRRATPADWNTTWLRSPGTNDGDASTQSPPVTGPLQLPSVS
jgi:hypothetical protein